LIAEHIWYKNTEILRNVAQNSFPFEQKKVTSAQCRKSELNVCIVNILNTGIQFEHNKQTTRFGLIVKCVDVENVRNGREIVGYLAGANSEARL
jgi:hypothetical protein